MFVSFLCDLKDFLNGLIWFRALNDIQESAGSAVALCRLSGFLSSLQRQKASPWQRGPLCPAIGSTVMGHSLCHPSSSFARLNTLLALCLPAGSLTSPCKLPVTLSWQYLHLSQANSVWVSKLCISWPKFLFKKGYYSVPFLVGVVVVHLQVSLVCVVYTFHLKSACGVPYKFYFIFMVLSCRVRC